MRVRTVWWLCVVAACGLVCSSEAGPASEAVGALEDAVADLQARVTVLENSPPPPPEESPAPEEPQPPEVPQPPDEPEEPSEPGGDVPGAPVPGAGLFGGVPGLAPDADAMVQWDVVAHRTFNEPVALGVLAFHPGGVRAVVIEAGGEIIATIEEPSLNTRVGFVEYAFVFDPGEFADGPVVLTATALTGNQHTTSKTVTVYANAGGGATPPVIELPADEYTWNAGPLVIGELTDQWITVQPAAGVPPEDVVISGEGKRISRGRVRLKDVTLTAAIKGGGKDCYLWLDGVEYSNPKGKADTWSDVKGFDGGEWWTNCHVHDLHLAGTSDFIRNCLIEDIGEDVARAYTVVVNNTIRRVFRPDGTKWHSDITGKPNVNGSIAYLNRIEDCDSNGSGVFAGGGGLHYRNSAVIGNVVNNPPKAFFIGSSMDGNALENWLFRGNTWRGKCGFRNNDRFKPTTVPGAVFIQDDDFDGDDTPDQWQAAGVVVHVGGELVE